MVWPTLRSRTAKEQNRMSLLRAKNLKFDQILKSEDSNTTPSSVRAKFSMKFGTPIVCQISPGLVHPVTLQ